MKHLILLFLFSFTFSVFSQKEVSSFYFGCALVDSNNLNIQFDSKILGNYSLSDDGFNQLIITKDSIYIKSGTPIIMTLNEVKQKGYTIENNKLIGLDKNRPLHCKLYNDTLFTIYYQEDSYFSSKNGDRMTRLNNGYLLSINEKNGFYSYFFIENEGTSLVIKSIDHENQMTNIYNFTTLYSQYLDGVKTYIAKPTMDEMLKFFNQKGFNEKSVFKLLKS